MKKYKTETTVFQKNVAENVLKQQMINPKKNINKKKAILEAGGSVHTARKPGTVFESKGYLAYMDKHGLTDDSIIGLIANDVRELAPGERFNYIKLLVQMKGMLEANVNINVTQSETAINAIQSMIDGQDEQ